MKDNFFLYQHKEATVGSHRIDFDELENLRKNAVDDYRRPAYVIDSLKKGKRYILIDEETYNELKDFLEHEQNTTSRSNYMEV